MTTAPQHVVMVWESPAPVGWPDPYTQACVKVCDGVATANKSGWSWAFNYRAWVGKFGQERVGAWCVAYPQDGPRLGEVLAAHAPHTPYVILDIEDFEGARWTDAQLRAVVEGVMRALPHALVGYSTYPTAAQAAEHHINQPLLDRLCNFSAPQVYYPYQRDRIAQIDKDNHRASWIVAPADDEHWDASVKASIVRSNRVFYWRMGVDGWQSWPRKTWTPPDTPAPPAPEADPLRPAADTHTYPARFVAYSGESWYLTDMLWRIKLTETEAAHLGARGVPILRWDAAVDLTADALAR